ncbi:hypothetical protein [Ferruginibacter sp. SUN106]|uniref:hypothetical protein n=1 Tax=Ferruginibacter sp. SUN106 TaxID=2978348 RepID=UPI003D367C3F
MATDNLKLAPPPKTVNGLVAVPMDIQHLQATVIFDGAASTATATAAITFITGVQDGCPVFDLRQTISTALLDGVAIAIADLAVHDFGGGPDAQMRIINRVLPAGTTHTLQVNYAIGLPQAAAGGGYPPAIAWLPGPRLKFNFGFTDLAPARYLESWFPANLIYDQFDIELDLQVSNTAIQHAVITNATVTSLGTNHWKLNFPARCTALSTLLEIRAADTLQHQSGTVLLPVSGQTVTVDAWKLVTDTATDLTVQINLIKNFLVNNENNIGAYLHGTRFTVFFNMGGMEYEGAATATTGTVKHETFHSWWARGIKPASQPDGWWDEAWTTYFNDMGGTTSTPFDFTASPVQLCTQNQWSRITAGGAYTDGNRFWEGMSSLIGNTNLKAYMKDFYNSYKNKLIKTNYIEEYLLCRSGNVQVVDAFHRFVYGFSNPSATPDLWMKDDTTDIAGNDNWAGKFWNSPDIWIRNNDDDGTTHQNAEYGQDNWIYARVRNKSATVAVKHFVVAFNVKQFAGTQFNYPADFLPGIAAASGFDLAAGSSMIVKARWPKNLVPAAGTHACLIAAVITRGEHPATNKFVWESNNLAQKNLTIVDLSPNGFIIIPFVISNYAYSQKRTFSLEVFRPLKYTAVPVTLLHPKPVLFSGFEKVQPFIITGHVKNANKDDLLDCSGYIGEQLKPAVAITDSTIKEAYHLVNTPLQEMYFKPGSAAAIAIAVKENDQLLLHVKVQVPADIKIGEKLEFDLVQRDSKTKKITGGIALQVNIIKQ